MAATNHTTVTHRPKGRVKCKLCMDTGVIERVEAKLLGHTASGVEVRGPRTMGYREACSCRQGWPKGGTK